MANTVNFFQPGTESAVDAAQIQRQRDIAAALLKQGQATPQGQMVSGHYVAPAATSYLSQLVSALAGGYKQREADQNERDLVQRVKSAREKESNDFLSAFTGTPGKAARDIQPLTPNDDEGNPMPIARADAVPGVPGDPSRALAIGMRSENPTLQALAAKLMEQKIQDSSFESAFGLGAGGGAPTGVPADGGAPAGPGGMPGAEPQVPGAAPGGAGKFLGEGFGQVPAGLARLAFRKDPAEVAKMVMEARKPVALREGDFIAPNGAGGVQSLYTQPKLEPGMQPVRSPTGAVTGAEMIPGYARGVASIAGAKAGATQGAESANTMVTIDTPQGPRMVTRAQAVQLSGGGAPTAAEPVPGMTNPTEAAMGRNAVINDNPSADAAREIAALRSDLNKVPDAASKQMIQAEIERLTAQVQKYSAGGGRGAVNPAGPGIPLQSESDKQYDTARAKDFATQAGAYQKARSSASGMLSNLDTLDQLFKDPNVANGGAAENISGLKNIASSFGLDVKGIGAEQAIQSITNKMALEQRSTADGAGMPGAMSDADRNFLKAQTPGLEKTPEGRALIIANQRKIAQRQIEVANMANAYERQNGRLDAGFDKQLAEYAAANRLFPDAPSGANAQRAAAPAAPDLRSLAAQELARRRAKNGG
ncbi:hypothetical protein J2W35_004959 [Variovorax boronicumulans]|uniref:hypothetical protein n=1 Tax=Variovorax boronicumulans TaxID=436515 RepID=UPI00277FBECF|nr:hypothetical protein [Variovorax boronicumulans]MDQ0084590.1 hypothetical protein [Variovorax boronicumulans]